MPAGMAISSIGAVTLPGGTLHVEWAADNHIRMTGPVEFEYEGVIDFSKLVKVSV